MKKILYSSTSSNILEWKSDPANLEINFTGTPRGNVLVTIDNRNLISAVKEYLDHKNFQFLKTLKNCLDFESLELILCSPYRIDVLSKVQYPNRFMRAKKVYLSTNKDLILWTILTAKEAFSINQIGNAILSGNSLYNASKFN